MELSPKPREALLKRSTVNPWPQSTRFDHVGIRFQAGLPALLQEIFRRLTKVPATARPVGVTSDSSPRAPERVAGAVASYPQHIHSLKSENVFGSPATCCARIHKRCLEKPASVTLPPSRVSF